MIIRSEVVTSRQNEAVKRLCSLVDKKGREAVGLFLLDGLKLFKEAVEACADVLYVYINEDKIEQLMPLIGDALSKPQYENTQIIRMEASLFERISQEKSPQGVITLVKYLDKIQNIIKINKVTTFQRNETGSNGVLFLNGIQDPGNLGAVIRSAVAFGHNRLILDADCVDIYHPRVLRSAMGGIFRLRAAYTDDMVVSIQALRERGQRVFAAELRDGAVPLHNADLHPSDSIVIGNEGHGISPSISRACDGSIYLPIAAGTESLNAAVAASIFLWEMREV